MGLDIAIVSLVSSSYYISSYAHALSENERIKSVRVVVPSHSDEIKTLDSSLIDLRTLVTPNSTAGMLSTVINPFLLHNLSQFIGSPDIIHIINEVRFPSNYLAYLQTVKSAPVVTTVHEPQPYDSGTSTNTEQGCWTNIQSTILNYIQRKNLRVLSHFSDSLIVHGEVLKSRLSDLASDNSEISVIPHGTLAPFFTRWSKSIDTEPQTILFFGRAVPGKGISYLVEAGNLIKNEYSNLNIIIAGNGFDKEQYDLGENFEIHNRRVDEKEAAKLFERAAIVVMPYTNASASGIISIAAGFNTPVIATDTGAIPEIIDNKQTGLIIPSHDAVALANAIRNLIDNPELREDLGNKLQSKIASEYDWGSIATESTEIYYNLIN